MKKLGKSVLCTILGISLVTIGFFIGKLEGAKAENTPTIATISPTSTISTTLKPVNTPEVNDEVQTSEPTSTPLPEPKLVDEFNGFKIYFVDYVMEREALRINLLYENNTKYDVWIQGKKLVVNGFTISPNGSELVAANSKAYCSIIAYKSDLESNRIDVDNIQEARVTIECIEDGEYILRGTSKEFICK